MIEKILKPFELFARVRFLLPLAISIYFGSRLFVVIFAALCLYEWVLRKFLETDRLSLEFHIGRHLLQVKILWSLVLYLGIKTIAKQDLLNFYLFFALITTILVSLTLVLIKEMKGNVKWGIGFTVVGVIMSLMLLPPSFKQIGWLNFLTGFSFIFEWVLAMRHLWQYEKGRKAPAPP